MLKGIQQKNVTLLLIILNIKNLRQHGQNRKKTSQFSQLQFLNIQQESSQIQNFHGFDFYIFSIDISISNQYIELIMELSALKNTRSKCCVCFKSYQQEEKNHLRTDFIRCQICNMAAHKYCYDPSSDNKQIVCDFCKKGKVGVRLCCICKQGDGLLKQFDTNKYGHVICLLFSPYYLVKSYEKLQFVQIKSSRITSQSICDICGIKGNDANLSTCSQGDCGKKCHWMCLIKQSISEVEGWAHSLWDIDSLQKIQISKYFLLFQAYIKQYFNNVFCQKPIIISQHNIIISANCQIYCGNHRDLYDEQCFCKKQNQQKMIFCDFCHSWNHVGCEKIGRYLPEKYRCIQCQDWESCVRKKKKPLLNHYPKFGLYDLIYIHQYFEKNKYQLAERQFSLLKKLPVGPSLYFYSRFTQLHLYQKVQSQIHAFSFLNQIYSMKKQCKNLSKSEKIKALKLIKILLACYEDLSSLKEELKDKKTNSKLLNIENAGTILKQFKQFEKKCMKLKKFIVSIRMEQITQTEIYNLKSHIKLQDTHKQYKRQQCSSLSKEQSQETESIQSNQPSDQIKKQDNNYMNQVSKMTESRENEDSLKNNQCIFAEQVGEQNQQSLNFLNCSMVETIIWKQVKKLRKKGRKQLLQIQRNLELAAQDRCKARIKPLLVDSEQISSRLALRSLELDLMSELFRLNLTTRQNILQGLKKSNIELSCSQKKVISLQSQIVQLMISLKQAQQYETRQQVEDLIYIQDIRECKLSYTNIAYFFRFFNKCRHSQLVKYPVVCNAFREIAQNMINCNTKRSIKNEQQIEAYETILNNLGLDSPWIEEEIKRKCEIQTIISRLSIQSQEVHAKLCMEIVTQAIQYCQEYKMGYMIPKLEQRLRWHRIHQQCSKIPGFYLNPFGLIQNVQKLQKIDGLIFKSIWLQMKDHQFPNIKIKQTIMHYSSKYQEQTQNPRRFLAIFDTNIRGECSDKKYSLQEISKWINQMNHSILDHECIINQIQQIVYVFDQLQQEILKHDYFTAETEELMSKIQVIPIIFPFKQQVVSKPRPMYSIDTSINAISIESSKNNTNQQSIA